MENTPGYVQSCNRNCQQYNYDSGASKAFNSCFIFFVDISHEHFIDFESHNEHEYALESEEGYWKPSGKRGVAQEEGVGNPDRGNEQGEHNQHFETPAPIVEESSKLISGKHNEKHDELEASKHKRHPDNSTGPQTSVIFIRLVSLFAIPTIDDLPNDIHGRAGGGRLAWTIRTVPVGWGEDLGQVARCEEQDESNNYPEQLEEDISNFRKGTFGSSASAAGWTETGAAGLTRTTEGLACTAKSSKTHIFN